MKRSGILDEFKELSRFGDNVEEEQVDFTQISTLPKLGKKQKRRSKVKSCKKKRRNSRLCRNK